MGEGGVGCTVKRGGNVESTEDVDVTKDTSIAEPQSMKFLFRIYEQKELQNITFQRPGRELSLQA